MNKERILVINPGSTSTKVALYQGDVEIASQTLQHSPELLKQYPTINSQLDFRCAAVRAYLAQQSVGVESLSAIAARGGIIGQLESGAYRIDDTLVEASTNSPVPHASNLAAVIADQLAKPVGIPAYIYDAVCGCGVPEEIYTITGLPELKKTFLTHVLNSRAVAIEQATQDGKAITDSTYIVTHMGGGITTNLLVNGHIQDIVGDDEGTFSPERAGRVPCRKLVKMCFNGQYDERTVQKRLKGEGGLMAYLGTNDMLEVEDRIAQGDQHAKTVYHAMAMQIAKDIGSMAVVVAGQLDGIILTGGLAQSKQFVDLIHQYVAFIAPVHIIPGTREMQALAHGILRVIREQESYRVFNP